MNLRKFTYDDFVPDVFDEINNNFSAVSDTLNSITDIIDIENKRIVGIEELNVSRAGLGDITDVLFRTNGSGRFGGNLLVNGAMETNNSTVQNNLTIENGILDIKNINSLSTIRGNMRVDGELVIGSARNTNVAMQFSENNKLNGLIGFSTYVVGRINPAGRSFMMLDFSGRNAGNTNNFLNYVRLENTGIKTGHVLDIFVLLPENPIELDTFKLVNGKITVEGNQSIINLPLDAAVQFTENYQGVSLIFKDTGWIIRSYYNGAAPSYINN